MARDVLAIPFITVSSESAFSLGGRILSDNRSSMTPQTLEALVCCKDWLYKYPTNEGYFNSPICTLLKCYFCCTFASAAT
jgi:hypothetical protein